MKKYRVVRLNYSIRDASGAFHQTHEFSEHRTLRAAFRAAEKARKTFNCVDVVDDAGQRVEVAA